jgi:hypothetical protein
MKICLFILNLLPVSCYKGRSQKKEVPCQLMKIKVIITDFLPQRWTLDTLTKLQEGNRLWETEPTNKIGLIGI